MEFNPAICYRAVQARDARYDGRFFTCVRTTGIYCRPICPARPPKLVNCVFVPTAAAAQEAGYRPCLRCRPESSPAFDAWRGTEAVVSRALKMIESGALDDGDVDALSDRLGIGSRQLRRLFRQHVGAAPITVAQTRRVLLAKQLIHQTDLSMVEVALASGFGSVRRFNETFQQMFDRPPSALRRHAGTSTGPEISILLPYRPPYDWDGMLQFFAARAIEGVEVVAQDSYRRVIEFDRMVGSIEITHVPKQSSLQVTVRLPRLNVLPTIIARVRRQFDLAAEPLAIAAALSSDSMLAPLVATRPGLRVPGAWDGFEVAVRAVLGQQITVKGATRLAGRIVASLGTKLNDVSSPGLTHFFPRAEEFQTEKLAALGMPRARAQSLESIARAALANPLLFEPRRDLQEAVAALCELEGVGQWSAHYIAMRAMGESDAFLAADVALRRKLAENGLRLPLPELLARAERWRPWRAYAMLYLWMSDSKAADSKTECVLQTEELCDALTA